MPPRLLITIDTELSNFPDGQGLWGRTGGGDWGLAKLIDAFDRLGLKATFFLDVYGGNDPAIANQRRAAEMIFEHGHDLQLHTHPAPAFERARERLRDYGPAEQAQIIELGCQRLGEWTGVRPCLHRAGDWGADHRSLEVLRQAGFRADFSSSVWSANCGIDRARIMGNGWRRIDGLLCGVGTCYRDGLTGRMRRVDLGGASFAEVVEMVHRRIDPLILTLHSFSLVRFNRTRTEFAPDPAYLDRLDRFCSLARNACGYSAVTALQAVCELESVPSGELPWSDLPRSGAVASGAGILKSVAGKLRYYLS